MNVLLAEDEALVAELLAETLAADGHDVEIASDGQQALALFGKAEAAGSPYDVLVTDVRMPVMDGVTLTRRLRANHPELPVVVLSGYAPSDQLAALSTMRNRPVVLLSKPVALDRLCAVVRGAASH